MFKDIFSVGIVFSYTILLLMFSTNFNKYFKFPDSSLIYNTRHHVCIAFSKFIISLPMLSLFLLRQKLKIASVIHLNVHLQGRYFK